MPEEVINPNTEGVINPTIKEMLPPKSNTTTQTQKPISKNTSIKKPIPKSINKNTLPKTVPKNKASIKKINKRKPFYRYIGKESLGKIIRKSVPKELIPTERMATTLGLIFLGVLIYALFEFPFGRLLSGDVNVVTAIGWPWHFLELGIMDMEKSPVLIKNLFIDLTIYIFAAYAIEVVIITIENLKIIKSEKEKMEVPRTFKDINSTMSSRMTEKLFGKKK